MDPFVLNAPYLPRKVKVKVNVHYMPTAKGDRLMPTDGAPQPLIITPTT